MPSIYLFCNIYMCRLLHADLQIDKPIKKTKDYFLSQQFLFIYKTLWLFVSKEFASYNVGWKQIHEIVLTQTMYTLLSTLVAITKIKWRKKRKLFQYFPGVYILLNQQFLKNFYFLFFSPWYAKIDCTRNERGQIGTLIGIRKKAFIVLFIVAPSGGLGHICWLWVEESTWHFYSELIIGNIWKK